MDVEDIFKNAKQLMEQKNIQPKGYNIHPSMLNDIKNKGSWAYRAETQNINATIFGFEFTECPFIPENIMTAYNNRGQIISIIKFEDGKVTQMQIDPESYYKEIPVRLEIERSKK